ncbi:hypothetical protein PanWU01x14_354140, partial [Parasponia andersonii]
LFEVLKSATITALEGVPIVMVHSETTTSIKPTNSDIFPMEKLFLKLNTGSKIDEHFRQQEAIKEGFLLAAFDLYLR